MRAQRGEFVLLGVLAAIGVAVAVRSVAYHVLGAGGRIGPGFMPLVAGGALAVFACWAFTEALVRRRHTRVDTDSAPAEPADATPADSPAERGAVRPDRRVWLVFAMTVAAFGLAFVTGFLVAFGALVCALLWFVEREKAWLAVSVGVVAALGSWLVFVVLLQVPLPGGVLGLLGGA